MLHGRICRERRTRPGSWPCTSPRIAVGPKNARGPRGPAGLCHPSHQHAGARRQGGRLSLSWEKFLLRPLSSLIRLQDLSHWRLTQRVDGTKLRASASRHKAMSHDRLEPKIEQLQSEVAAILAEAEATDRAEDEEFGEDKRGDEVPAELARRETRLAKMRAAKEAIEAEAREKAAAKAAAKAAEGGGDESAIAEAAEIAAANATPNKKAQRSFTDPESRMMKTNAGFHYCYNAQAVVDEESQVVLAAEATQQASDVDQLLSMVGVT